QGIDRFAPTTAFVGAADQAPLSPGAQYARGGAVIEMRVLELLTARLCHELSAPIAAINNGVELLTGEDMDPEAPETSFMRDAAALIGDSARRARSRLQFYRFAYGFGQSVALAGPPPHELAVDLFDASRIICDYSDSVRILPLDWQKPACNLLTVGA